MAVTFIKVTEEEQIEKIAEIAAPIWHETYDCINGVASTDYMIEKFQSVPAIHRQMESEGYVYYMMLDDGVPAGFIGLVPHKEGKMFLSKLYVSAAHRSRGLPRAAFDFIETVRMIQFAVHIVVNVVCHEGETHIFFVRHFVDTFLSNFCFHISIPPAPMLLQDDPAFLQFLLHRLKENANPPGYCCLHLT